ALSGIVNNSIREGGSQVSGSINYQNSTLPGKVFGTVQDQLLGNNLLRGYLAGPVPGTSSKVRYSVSGQVESGARQVLEFDQDVFSVNEDVERREVLPPSRRDLVKGWQAFGGDQNSQIVGKLTFLPFDNTKINIVGIGAERSTKNYERRYSLSYRGDPLARVNNRADSLYVINDAGNVLQQDLSQPSVRDQGNLYLASLVQRFGRSNLELRVAQTDFERVTCPFFRGTCLPAPFCRANFADGFINPTTLCNGVPDQGGVDQAYGGEKFTSRTFRADLQSQVTDHNNIQVGAQFVQHDMVYADQTAGAGNSGISPVTYLVYRAKPIDAAAYIQAVIEYDFLTIRLGGRFDYGRAKGLGFTDPFDPSNGTTARQVCEGTTVAGQKLVNAQGQPFGTTGCFASAIDPKTKRPTLLDSATKLAQLDDFSEAKTRTAFSPRIGVNFPLTEKSQIFFNAGRYTKTPNYGDVYRNTGVGTVAGRDPLTGEDRYCDKTAVKPGTTECVPDIKQTNSTFVGNPNLLLEEAKSYEVGYSTTLGANDNYGLQLAMFNRAETGLTSTRSSRAIQDIGSTYDGSAPTYRVLVNGDFLTARGMEVSLDRRLSNRWSYGVNYGLARSTTNGRPPERADEIDRTEANRRQLIEAVTDQDVTHTFNLQGGIRVRNDIPDVKYNLGRFLRNTSVNATYSFRSGVPYTPQRATSLGNSTTTNNASENLSGRQPNVQNVGLVVDKQFSIQNVSYSAFFRVSNLLDRKNCNQVFANTGKCDAGLRDFANRRIGNAGDAASSTSFDQPEYIGARRSLFTGITVNF
ncbi:MAG: TonB-dependent receptor, partial [Gemmatimonas sp.]